MAKPATQQKAATASQEVQEKPVRVIRYRYQLPEQPEEWVPDEDYWR